MYIVGEIMPREYTGYTTEYREEKRAIYMD